MFINVTLPPYNARGDNSLASAVANDTAFRSALAALAAAPAPRTLYIPAGRYFLSTAIRAEVSDLTVYGQAGATLIGKAPTGSLTPEVFLIDVTYNNGSSVPAQTNPVFSITIRDLRIEGNTGAGITSAFTPSMIVANGCVDLLISGVTIAWTGLNDDTTAQTDGIAVGANYLGTPYVRGTTGVVRNCVCDKIPKAAFYAAQGSHDVQFIDCTATNATGPISGVGFIATSSTRILFVNCVATGCSHYGLFIGINNPAAATAGSSQIEVVGGAFRNNAGIGPGCGVFIGSGATTFCPSGVRITGAEVSGNKDDGVLVSSAVDVTLANLTVFDNNNFGVHLVTPRGLGITSRVQIVGCQVYNNRRAGGPLAGIALDGRVDQIDVLGGRTYNNAGTGQTIGVGYYNFAAYGPAGSVRVVDVDTQGETRSLAGIDVNGNLDPNAFAAWGYVRLAAAGAPEGQVPAPPGSDYTDTATGKVYRKATGVQTTGWTPGFP